MFLLSAGAASPHRVFFLSLKLGVMGWILSPRPWVKACCGKRAYPAPHVCEDPHVRSSGLECIMTITTDINEE